MISIHPFQNGNHETKFLEKYTEVLPKYSHVTILFSEMTAAMSKTMITHLIKLVYPNVG